MLDKKVCIILVHFVLFVCNVVYKIEFLFILYGKY